MFPSKLALSFSLSITFLCLTIVQSPCANTTCLALGSYYLWNVSNLTYISKLTIDNISYIQSYNPQITNPSHILAGNRINIPFSCGCIDHDQFLGHVFQYTVRPGDFYNRIADTYYSHLTTIAMMEKYNRYPADYIPVYAVLNVTVNCSCGNMSVSNASAVFVTYPLRDQDSLGSIATAWNVSTVLLQKYNPGVDFNSGSRLVYIPYNNASLSYPPPKSSPENFAPSYQAPESSPENFAPSYQAPEASPDNNATSYHGRQESSSGFLAFFFTRRTFSGGRIAGISLGAVMGALLVAVCIYCGVYKQKEEHVIINNLQTYEDLPLQAGQVTLDYSASPCGLDISVDKSVEFSNEELAKATNDFNDDHKIGEGGFGAVYYAELRGKKTAIKKMDVTTNTTKQFYSELQILTQVNHMNLVRLIGYCMEGYLFLVYEYIENGNLSEHLHGTGSESWDPLPWSTRVQIALDSAKGLEYIHELTVPAYIHRDIKSANILIDKNFRAKVADFGLTRLHEATLTHLVGTFGYMPPEVQYGDLSPKGDVYAFGVVLYELISAKKALIKPDGSTLETKRLGSLFEDALSKPDPREDLCKLIDPRLGDNYPFDSILELAQLAKTCTQVDPEQRPCMRFVVVDLMRLSSSTEEHRRHFQAYGGATVIV